MTDDVTAGELGESSGVVCEHCGEGFYRRIRGVSEDTEYLGGEQYSCLQCGDGRYLRSGLPVPFDEEVHRPARVGFRRARRLDHAGAVVGDLVGRAVGALVREVFRP